MAVRGASPVADPAFFGDYPFLPGAEVVAEGLAASIRGLLEDVVLERARDLGRARIRVALEDPRGTMTIDELARADAGERFLSFQYARLVLGAATSAGPVRRWAVSESKRASARLSSAPLAEVLAVAREVGFGFEEEEGGVAIPLVDYLRLATPIREADFRLSHQEIAAGRVHVGRARAARLLEEGIRRRLSSPLPLDPAVRGFLVEHEAELLREIHERMPPPAARPGLLGGKVVPNAFPPCIRKMRRTLEDGENLSHAGRFALAAFLHRVGADEETIVDAFRGAPDFDEGITRYQVDHITHRNAGEGYTPPECETLRSHGLCCRDGDPAAPNPEDRGRDERCFDPKMRHPLTYYEWRSGLRLPPTGPGEAPDRP
jgi:DNA primase large subunit